jgi:hypothetical protein
VPLDLSTLGDAAGAAVTDPRDIFAAIPSKPFPRLRLEQGEVLKAWYQDRTRRDTVIKQNTGGGKTTIGLLIAQSSLNEGVGPAVYLTPDTYLAEQVIAEADSLHIPTTRDPKSEEFLAGEAVLVTTFARLINGRSTFGVAGSGRQAQPLGVVVIDDAHSALGIAEAQFRTTVPSSHAAFIKLTDLFTDALKGQSPSGWRAIDRGQPAAPVPVPFWSWQANVDRVRDILEEHTNDSDLSWLFFSWPLVDQVLELCNVTVTSDKFEIRPPCSPVELIPSFANANRRIYLTATLADDGVLVTDLGADETDVATPVTPERAADLGDRIILAPLALNTSLSEDAVRDLVYDFSRGKRDSNAAAPNAGPLNAIVLVPSEARAKLWSEHADHIWRVGDLKKNAQRLRGEWLGVVVLVNKYDGVDLPGDACRLLVIDGVPFPLTPGESREAAALSGTDTFAARQTQRIEQGMGRGIRDAEDHCAVLLMGSNLAMSIRAAKQRKHYSPATEAQIKLSMQVAAQIQGEGMQSLREAIDMFLRRDPGWLRASSRATAGAEYNKTGLIGAESSASRHAFDLARAGQPEGASQVLLDGIRTLPPYERGWYMEQAAAYANLYNPDRAQAILKDARLANVNVTKPLTAEPIRPLRASAIQADAASQYLSETYGSGVELELGLTNLLERMVYDKDRTDDAESAFEQLGAHLGLTTERPDKLYGTGPDVLWAINDDKHLLVELKTGVVREDVRIIKHELDQASGHVSWHQENYGRAATAIPVFVHPSHFYVPNGTPPEGTRVIDPDTLQSIKDRVLAFARAIQAHDGWKVPDVVKTHLLQQRLNGADALLATAPKTASAPNFVQNPLIVAPATEGTDVSSSAASDAAKAPSERAAAAPAGGTSSVS